MAVVLANPNPNQTNDSQKRRAIDLVLCTRRLCKQPNMCQSKESASNHPSSSRRNPNPTKLNQQLAHSPIAHPASGHPATLAGTESRDTGKSLIGQRIPYDCQSTNYRAKIRGGAALGAPGNHASRKRSIGRGYEWEVIW